MDDAVLDRCPNCGEKVKIGAFSANQFLAPHKIDAINLVHGQQRSHACNRCGEEDFYSARSRIQREIAKLTSELEKVIGCVPIVSIHSPHDWSYRTIGLVTAQSVTGTGVLSDITTAFTDTFGIQSNRYNSKIRAGEALCRNSLRLETVRIGGNAIVAADVDYAEVGGQRAMLMVCMTGTAVELADLEATMPGYAEQLAQVLELNRKLSSFQNMNLED